MSELNASYRLGLEAQRAAEEVSQRLQAADTDAQRVELAREHDTLRAMAALALGPTQGEIVDNKMSAEARSRLTMPIGDVATNLQMGSGVELGYTITVRGRAYNALGREELPTLREVLVAGRIEVSHVRNLGETGMNFLGTLIKAIDPDIIWPDHPPADIASQLYTSLDEIPARVIDSAFQAYCIQETGLSVHSVESLRSLSIADLISLLEVKYENDTKAPDIPQEARVLQKKIATFETAFREAAARRK